MLKVGIIGARTMGSGHAGRYSEIPETSVAGVFDIDFGRASVLAESVGAKAYPSADDLISDPNVDIICICTPTNTHADYTIKSLRAGKHVFCEKPIARTLEEGSRIAEEAERSDRVFMVGHVLRFFPEYLKLKEIIDSGGIGRPGVVRFSRIAQFPQGGDDWYAKYDISGGVVLDMIIHDFDFLNWCFGRPIRVSAKGLGREMLSNHIDYALVLIRFENGVIAQVEGSWAIPKGFYTKYEVAGDKGLVSFDSRAASPISLAVKAAEGAAEGVAVPESPVEKSPYLLEQEHFVSCILEGRKPDITPEDALEALKVSLAALESIETGKIVRF